MWIDAKAGLTRYLETIEVASPFEGGPVVLRPQAIYQQPPSSITEDIAFVMYHPATVVTRENVRRQKVYDVRVRVLVADAGDTANASAILEAFRETMIDVFDGWTKLGLATDVSRADGPNFDEAAGYNYGGREFIGADAHFRIITSETREHGA